MDLDFRVSQLLSFFMVERILKMIDKVYVPPVKIQGIKTKLVPFISKGIDIEEDAIWFEPFMGSGVVGLNLAPKHAVFADTNPHVIRLYNQIKHGKMSILKEKVNF